MALSYNELMAAVLAFVGGHFLLCSRPLRQGLISRLGAHGARLLTALALLAGFVWMIFAYGRAPDWVLWSPPAGLAWVPMAVMPFACILMVAAVSTPSPTGVAGAALVNSEPRSTVSGIVTVTRHPMLWAFVLWALSHLLVAGKLATVILLLGILLLGLGGMRHIDLRREAELGSAWGPIKLTSSVLPFLAIANRRCKFDWHGIGWARLIGGLALYVAILFLHGRVIGLPALPN